MKIAIIGAGISGLGAAWLLRQAHDVTVYEPNNYAGGHSRTIDIYDGHQSIAVDTGFIVFNHRNYPHLTNLFRHLDVPTIPSDMSFGASIGNGWLEYGSKGMFAQKANLLRPAYWGMLRDIVRFNREALKFIKNRGDMTLQECLEGMKMGDWFCRYYLQAMGAAIWSCPVETILKFPAQSFLQFFENHGLLTINDHPQWHTVKGGSREYVSLLTASLGDNLRLNCGAVAVIRHENHVTVRDSQNNQETYDHVIFACHADQALKLIENPTASERAVLGAFAYQKNQVVVHSDISFMPQRKACWSSWVYLSEELADKEPSLSLSYWMNSLQDLDTDMPVIITLNPGRSPAAHLVHDRHSFDHPVFTLEALHAQNRIKDIQGLGNIWHCGAYQRYGFHEDGLLSAISVTKALGVDTPWT